MRGAMMGHVYLDNVSVVWHRNGQLAQVSPIPLCIPPLSGIYIFALALSHLFVGHGHGRGHWHDILVLLARALIDGSWRRACPDRTTALLFGFSRLTCGTRHSATFAFAIASRGHDVRTDNASGGETNLGWGVGGQQPWIWVGFGSGIGLCPLVLATWWRYTALQYSVDTHRHPCADTGTGTTTKKATAYLHSVQAPFLFNFVFGFFSPL